MALEDIGYMIFGQFLGMTQYPGAPFTGNIYRDLIMFLLVPTIFIIMVLYIMSGRIIPNRNFRIMLGVGAYLFIIAGGYYSFFALLAGPYFIFLIFILGVLGYLGSHFRSHGGGGPYSRGGGYSGGGGYSRNETDWVRLREVKTEIAEKEARLKEARATGSRDEAGLLHKEISDLKHELNFLEKKKNPMKKYV